MTTEKANTQSKKAASRKPKVADRNKDQESTEREEIKTIGEDKIEVLPPEDAADNADEKKEEGKDAHGDKGGAESQELAKPLSPEDKELFNQLDRQLQKSFVEVAIALKVIKEKQLYREEFDSFESYCEDRIGRSRRYVDYMVTFAIIRGILVEHNVPEHLLPTSEAQVRPLGKYKDDPQKLTEHWLKACDEAGDTVPSREQVQATEKKLDTKPTTQPALQEGDYVKLTKAYKDEEGLRNLVGYWGYVEKVYKKGTLNVRFPQQTLESIPRDALTKIKEQSEEQQGEVDRKEVFEKLQAIYNSKKYREPIVEANLRLLGKRQDAHCTSLEQELLVWLLEHLTNEPKDD